MKDDRRYETYEMRAAYDPRYVIDPNHITSKAARKAAQAEADRIYVRMGEIRAAARSMDPNSEEYAASVRSFAACADQRSAIFARIREYDETH